MFGRSTSNLPPGVTNAMIEDQCADDDFAEFDAQYEKLQKAFYNWNGNLLRELFANMIEASGDDPEDVLAETRGEIELREIQRKRAQK